MQLSDVVFGLLHRLQLSNLKKHHHSKRVQAVFMFINGGLSIGIIGLLAHVTHNPFLFPSLGSTAFLLFYKPLASSASPRNTIIGHSIAITIGWLCYHLFGISGNVVSHEEVVTWSVIGAASVSISFTFALMVLFNVAHPPAGATTLIVSLGVITKLKQFPVILLGVVLLTLQAFVILRLAGMAYPYWSPTQIK